MFKCYICFTDEKPEESLKSLARGCPADKWQGQESSVVSLVPEQSQGERMGDEWHRGGVGEGKEQGRHV